MQKRFEKSPAGITLIPGNGEKNRRRPKGKFQVLSKSTKGIASAGGEFYQEDPRHSRKYKNHHKDNIYFSW